MAKLVLTDESSQVFELKAGLNRLGRRPDNDIHLADTNVSGSHCEILLEHGVITVRDSGSTNGTFINSQRVRESILQPGDLLRVGSSVLRYQADPVPVAANPIRIRAVAVTEQQPALPPVVAATVATGIAPGPGGPDDCLNHPGVPARFICQSCQRIFCPPCASTQRLAAAAAKICPTCGGFCVDLAKSRARKKKMSAGFLRLAQGALAYPFQKDGWVILICGSIFFGVIDGIRTMASSVGVIGLSYWFLLIFSTGYLFAYLKSVIVSSASGEDEMPGWPEFSNFSDDIVPPFFQFIGIWVACLGPGILTLIFGSALVGAALLLLGLLVMPMAMLAVAMTDGFGGLNPILLLSSIAKVFGPYFIVCLLALGLVAAFHGINLALSQVAIPVLPYFVATFVSLYLLMVEMRMLGLLYLKKQERLAWF